MKKHIKKTTEQKQQMKLMKMIANCDNDLSNTKYYNKRIIKSDRKNSNSCNVKLSLRDLNSYLNN